MKAARLKIGFVLDDSLDKADGVQQYVLTMGEWLRSQGHDVHYLVSTSKRTDVANVHSLSRNMAVRFNGNRMSMPLPASKRALKSFLAGEQFDVLHVQMPYSPLLAQKVIRLAAPHTAIIGTFHVAPYARHVTAASRLLAVWNGRSLKRFNTIVSVSTAAQAFAKQVFGIESSVLPNVIDYHRFASATPLPKKKDVVRIMFLGRLVPRKGCMVLLQAIRELNTPLLPKYEVFICGKGPLAPELNGYVAAHAMGDRVSFQGFVSEEDKPAYLRSADIAVFPSSGGESFGIVLIEAMAAGAAVLAGDNVGYRTVMEPKPELLFNPLSPPDLAEKLEQYLRHTADRQAAQRWGKDYSKRFDTATVGAQLVDIYTQALRKRRDVQ